MQAHMVGRSLVAAGGAARVVRLEAVRWRAQPEVWILAAAVCHSPFGQAVPWSAASGWLAACQTGLMDSARTGACQTPEAVWTSE